MRQLVRKLIASLNRLNIYFVDYSESPHPTVPKTLSFNPFCIS
jgi:hypothetical protein